MFFLVVFRKLPVTGPCRAEHGAGINFAFAEPPQVAVGAGPWVGRTLLCSCRISCSEAEIALQPQCCLNVALCYSAVIRAACQFFISSLHFNGISRLGAICPKELGLVF